MNRTIHFKFKRLPDERYQWTINTIDDVFYCHNLFEIMEVIRVLGFDNDKVLVYRDGVLL